MFFRITHSTSIDVINTVIFYTVMSEGLQVRMKESSTSKEPLDWTKQLEYTATQRITRFQKNH